MSDTPGLDALRDHDLMIGGYGIWCEHPDESTSVSTRHPFTCEWCDGEWADWRTYDTHFGDLTHENPNHPYLNPASAIEAEASRLGQIDVERLALALERADQHYAGYGWPTAEDHALAILETLRDMDDAPSADEVRGILSDTATGETP